MAKTLIIVESPAKIKTLKKFLGSQYIFESSIGHIRDLPQKEFGIDLDHDFEPTYVTMEDKKQVIDKLKRAAKQCDTVLLSPDPDREGEAIAWHISQILPPGTKYQRISFNAITKDEVQRALKEPRPIDTSLVNAQQARRLLDRIVGYKISPFLNRRIQRGREKGVSAGRVQSVALKLVVDREKEIEAFIPVEYWNLGALLSKEQDERRFRANLSYVDGKKVEKEAIQGKDVFLINNGQTAEQIIKRLKGVPYKVEQVERKEKKRNPLPPFITSTLQQEASRHHGYSSSRTMSIAQSLYEGIDLGNEGPEGLITYMRTDSVRLSPQAIDEARSFIASQFGKNYLPDTPRQYTAKKAAQDAHEAIRPASLAYPPEQVKGYLSKEQFNLYQLIWRRFIASQMVPAIYDTLGADISAGEGIILRATGSVLKFPGYLAAYEEKLDDDDTKEEEAALPDLQEGEKLNLLDLFSEQAFTRPPPRYTEASLVKELEKSGIGRPSTYASIMSKIQGREYTTKEQGRLKPTELGRVIAQLLEANFQKIMDIGFTASMEDDLELIAESKKEWKTIIRDFWKDFLPTLEVAEKEGFIPKLMTDKDCPQCDGKLQKVWFRNKYFYGCSNYPTCHYSAPLEELEFDKTLYAEDFNWKQECPKCGSEMKVRHGPYGAFLGCTRYPDCKGIVQIPKKGEVAIPEGEMPPCPAIGCPGKIAARRSRFGKVFYSCSTYPECDVIVNNLDDLSKKYPEHPRTPYIKKQKRGVAAKKETKKTKKGPAKKRERSPGKPVTLIGPLHVLLKETSLPRPEVLKRVWDYIKAHNLQDPKDKRRILPDAPLAAIFGTKDPVPMTKVMGLLSSWIE